MPNGYRRGGTVSRGGRTHYRRSTSIRGVSRLQAGVLVVGVIGVTALTGGTLSGSVGLTMAVASVVAGMLVYRNRRRLRPVGRKLVRWAEGRYPTRNTRPMVVARAPRVQR